jgi:hypothetical protein
VGEQVPEIEFDRLNQSQDGEKTEDGFISDWVLIEVRPGPNPTTSGSNPTTSGSNPTTSGSNPTTSGSNPTTSG